MVTRSDKDYAQHKIDVFNEIKSSYGEEKAKRFLEVYSSRYDKYGRSFIDYKLAFSLMDDIIYLDRIGSRWYACVGVGGTGKTTIMKNIFYFLDPTFSLESMSMDLKGFVLTIDKFFDIKNKAIFMDEPDDTITANSKEGKLLREVFGKIRQQHIALGVCATDLKDIPPYMFRKLDGIIFCPSLGKGMFFKNKPKKGDYVLQKIRNKYSEEGYQVFLNLRQSKGCLNFTSIASSPLDLEQKDAYLSIKRDDYKQSIKDYLKQSEKKPEVVERDVRRDIMMKMREKGMTNVAISKILGISRPRVAQLLGNLGKV
jgi:hypothetical protein